MLSLGLVSSWTTFSLCKFLVILFGSTNTSATLNRMMDFFLNPNRVILEMNKSTRFISPWNQNRCILMQRKVNISWEICISLDTLSQNKIAKRCYQSRSINWNCSLCFAVISLVLFFMCKHNQTLHYFITWKTLGMICVVLFVVVYSQ